MQIVNRSIRSGHTLMIYRKWQTSVPICWRSYFLDFFIVVQITWSFEVQVLKWKTHRDYHHRLISGRDSKFKTEHKNVCLTSNLWSYWRYINLRHLIFFFVKMSWRHVVMTVRVSQEKNISPEMFQGDIWLYERSWKSKKNHSTRESKCIFTNW